MKLALLGCGLLGGSAAAAWRRAGAATTVTGFDRDADAVRRGIALGMIDTAAGSLAEAVAGADCVLLATPVGAMPALLGALAPHLRDGAIVTDVGSTKEGIVDAARAALGAKFARFVPAHPIAGAESHGIDNAAAELFDGRWVIVTPAAETAIDALRRIESAWTDCGAIVERMEAREHDRIFAAVSHLPHLAAFALMRAVAAGADGSRCLQFAGAGFRDFTRIAASDATMWRDVALANREALGRELAAYRAELDALQAALDHADGAALQRMFEDASRVRRGMRFGAFGRNEVEGGHDE